MALSVTYTTFCGQVVYENRAGTERFYAPDPLGSTAALLDSTGAKTDEYVYWPYGEIRSHTGTSATPLTFCGTLGYFMDSATRFYVRARMLLANYARWLSVDPLWPRQRAYGYAGQDPASKTDPSGLSECRVQDIDINLGVLSIVLTGYHLHIHDVWCMRDCRGCPARGVRISWDQVITIDGGKIIDWWLAAVCVAIPTIIGGLLDCPLCGFLLGVLLEKEGCSSVCRRSSGVRCFHFWSREHCDKSYVQGSSCC